jgi:hypothetical protein
MSYRLIEDWCNRHFPVVQYRKLAWVEDEIDDVHRELPDRHKRFEDSIALRAYVDTGEPQRTPHSRFGLERVRKPALVVSVPHLISAGLAQQDDTSWIVTVSAESGDRFIFSTGDYDGAEIEYEVLSVQRGRMFGNTDIPLTFRLPSERRRLDSSEYADV